VGASVGACMTVRPSPGIPGGCGCGDGTGLLETGSSLWRVALPCSLGTLAHVAQMEQQVVSLQRRGAKRWRAEHGQRGDGTAAWHRAGMAVSPAGVRMAAGPKALVPDGCEGYSHRRVGGVEGPELPGVSLGRRHRSRSCRWNSELCVSPGQQPASL